ncbi:hypothetical protein COB55_05370 [Candidatus Wolfebacteria bacterium]|nr:MAG: hypothetical protein COB55_05370 [Candidatus Wolfebacteria bacterium]
MRRLESNLLRLTANSAPTERCDEARSEFSTYEIMASLAGLNDGPYLLARWMWCGEEDVIDKLLIELTGEVKKWAIKNRWRCRNDDIRLLALTRCALVNLKNNRKCNPCNGTGIMKGRAGSHGDRFCDDCNGKGTTSLKKNQMAKLCGVASGSFNRVWQEKLGGVMAILQEWEDDLSSHMHKKLISH